MARPHDVLCPYCFMRWSTRVAAFRCTSRDEARCKPVADEALGRLQGTAAPTMPCVTVHTGRFGQAFSVKAGHPVRCGCGSPTFPVCPFCHHKLPQRFADARSHSMALIGTKGSGKTKGLRVALGGMTQARGASTPQNGH